MKKYILISLVVAGLSSQGYSEKASFKDATRIARENSLPIAMGAGFVFTLAGMAGLTAHAVKLHKASKESIDKNKQLLDLYGELSTRVDDIEQLSETMVNGTSLGSTVSSIKSRHDRSVSALVTRLDAIEGKVVRMADQEMKISDKAYMNTAMISSLSDSLAANDRKVSRQGLSIESLKAKIESLKVKMSKLVDHQEQAEDWIKENVGKTKSLLAFPLNGSAPLEPLKPIESSYVNIEMSETP